MVLTLGVVWATSAHAAMPLLSVDYTIDVDGPLAEVVVDQVFVNDGDEAVDAVYVFPLHEEAAVDGMEMVVGDQRIVGHIAEREQATVAYEEAVEQGFTAALTAQERPNVFTQRVGNIPPGEEVVVRIRTVQPVPHVDGAYELVVPLVVAPRFVAPEDGSRAAGTAHERPFAGMALEGSAASAGLDIRIDSGLPFTGFDCPSHEVSIGHVDDLARAISTRQPLDRDFVLRWTVARERPLAAVHVMDGHALLTLEPPEAPPRDHIVPRELIWVIDRSCSMRGGPLDQVKEAMLTSLDHVDARDSVRILRFSTEVEGHPASVPATPAVLAQARREIRALDARGGTYLLNGVLAALDTPPDPGRERMVVFLTDGRIGTETSVLAAIADRVGAARLFAFGAGPTPNRWLLDEMARFGGGRTTWLRAGESPKAAAERFVDTISRPVLTDIEVDWGDWEVVDTQPRRLPALHAGQPLLLTTRITRRGTTPVVVRGRLGDGQFETVVTPREAEAGRAIPSTWARQKIGALERDQVWGEVPEVADEILATSLSMQVLSQYTAFLAVDPTRRAAPGRPTREEAPEEGWALAQAGGAEEIVVLGQARAVNVETTTSSTVLSKDLLKRVPSGRSYQSAVGMAAGVTGGGGSPNIAGAAYNENTYLLDGANLTDPVTGTFSMNFDFDALAQVEVHTGVLSAAHAGSAPVVAMTSASGTNNLDASVEVSRLSRVDSSAPPLTATSAGGALSGPVVRDRMWLAASYDFDQSALDARGFQQHAGAARLTAQPSTDHRVSVVGAANASAVSDGEARAAQDAGLGSVSWEWFLSPDVHIRTQATGQGSTVFGDRRDRQQLSSTVSLVELRDPAVGRHDVQIGTDVDRSHWAFEGTWAADWLGVNVAPEAEVTRGGWFLQDAWKATRRLSLDLGLRGDHTLGRAHLGPRLGAALDPFGSGRAKLAAGFGRSWGHLGLPTVAIAPARGLSRKDELFTLAEVEVVADLVLGLRGALALHGALPTYGGGRADMRTVLTESWLRKDWGHRWDTRVSWRHARVVGEAPDAPLVDDGSVARFAHTGSAEATWLLPTDPYTFTLGAMGTVGADPLTTTLPDPSTGNQANIPGWTAGLRLAQQIPLRRGFLEVQLQGQHVALLPDDRPVPALVGPVSSPLLQQVGWEGPRVEGGVEVAF